MCVGAELLSRVRVFATPWTVACQAPLSMKFSRQEYWSGLPFPSPEDLPDPGGEPPSPASPDSLPRAIMETHTHTNGVIDSTVTYLPDSYVEALTPSTSECNYVWK